MTTIMHILIYISLVAALCHSKEAFFDAVPKELRCSGCEITVKVLDRMMKKPSKSLNRHVDDVIEAVCDEKRFQISEYKASTMLKVCNFIKDYHGRELHAELMKYYAHPTKSTYFEFSQHFCIDVLKMCAAVSHKSKSRQENDSALEFDRKAHSFGVNVKPGQKIKMPMPVRDTTHDEL